MDERKDERGTMNDEVKTEAFSVHRSAFIFHQPVFVGDLVSFYAETVRIGMTSITIRVIVEAERPARAEGRVRVTEAEVVYVAVDENRQKIKINKEQIEE